MRYVTYDEFGNLTGCYDQDLLAQHEAAHFPMNEVQARQWPAYQMSEARDGLELAPVAMPEPVIAESVPMLNLQLILIDDGKLGAVEAIINGMEGDDGDRARAYWSKALTARRDNYLVDALWPAIGYDLAGFNDAWARAAALNP